MHLPEDRLQAHIQTLIERQTKMLHDCSYIRDHPVEGKGGIQRIYRFDNGFGAVVDWIYRKGGGFDVQPVTFFGPEVTSYTASGDATHGQNEDQVNATLDAIKDTKFEKPAPAQIPDTAANDAQAQDAPSGEVAADAEPTLTVKTQE